MKKILICYSLLFVGFNSVSQTDTLRIKNKSQADTNVNNFTIPIFSAGSSDAESGLDEQDLSSLLQSSRDLFTQFTSFQFGVARYRIRGYSAENQLVMINGVNVNNPETGFSSWSSWGGLNDVTRFTETRFGNVNSRYGFSGPGGYTNIDSKASSFKKGTRVSCAGANNVFHNRMMLTHSTGIMKNRWALTFSASYRNGNEVYIPGTSFDAKSFYVSIDKKCNDKHLFSFTGFDAPMEKGLSGAETRETYNVAGSHYYNSLWGYQNGKVRNASVSRTNRPMLMLSHIYTPDQKSHLTTTLFYNFGKSGLTGINFNNAPNPHPDYYKYLPGYFYANGNIYRGDKATLDWQNDVHTRQINWDRLIALNRANLFTLPPQSGQTINTNETRARYILEDRVENLNHFGFNTVYQERKKNLFLSLGANASMYKNRKYKEMEDLLGSTFWIDVDQFAQNLGVDPMIQQNDINHPDKKIYKGDPFGYNYIIHIHHAEIWGQAEYTLKKLDFYSGISLSGSSTWRTGKLANGKFPTSSKGDSEKLNFLNYGFKAGATYKLSGRNFITANVTVLSRAPEAANIFVSPRVRNDIVGDLKSEEVISGDLNYLAKYPGLKIRFTLYSTQINNQTWLRTYWDDNYNTNVNLIMTGVNQKHSGLELGIDKTLFTSHTLQGVVGFAQSLYTNSPKLQAWQDNNNTSLFLNRPAYLKNYRLGSSPQFVSGIAYKYTAKKLWFAGACFNYFDQIYIEANPNRRTAESAGKFQVNEKEQVQQIIGQERLPAYFTLNVNAGKSFRLRKKYNLNINGGINNILNNRNILTGGYEQLRWDQQQISKFPNKYYYMIGITYMLIINLSF
jgi:hypothetical protein